MTTEVGAGDHRGLPGSIPVSGPWPSAGRHGAVGSRVCDLGSRSPVSTTGRPVTLVPELLQCTDSELRALCLGGGQCPSEVGCPLSPHPPPSL